MIRSYKKNFVCKMNGEFSFFGLTRSIIKFTISIWFYWTSEKCSFSPYFCVSLYILSSFKPRWFGVLYFFSRSLYFLHNFFILPKTLANWIWSRYVLKREKRKLWNRQRRRWKKKVNYWAKLYFSVAHIVELINIRCQIFFLFFFLYSCNGFVSVLFTWSRQYAKYKLSTWINVRYSDVCVCVIVFQPKILNGSLS